MRKDDAVKGSDKTNKQNLRKREEEVNSTNNVQKYLTEKTAITKKE